MHRKPSARSLAGTTVATLVGCIVIAGCHHTSVAATSTASTAMSPAGAASTTASAASATASAPPAATSVSPAGSAAATPSGTGSCEVWPGVGALAATAFPLEEAATDIDTNGYEDSSDSLAVNVAVAGLVKLLPQLPDSYAQEIQNDVITPAGSGNASELDTAASNAQSIATTISQLCYTP
jgi:hypothetical protein